MHFKKQSPRNLRRLSRKAAKFHARIHIRTGIYHLILPGYCTFSFSSFTKLWEFTFLAGKYLTDHRRKSIKQRDKKFL